jgi:single-stranded DNA-specific DHH superfamily exonuclease
MIKKEELQEILIRIEKSDNPLILFDDDPDGLCSFLILWRHIQKGKGIPVKGMLSNALIPKIKHENPDLLIILDKPTMEEEFLEELSMPIIHIDHHPLIPIKKSNYLYYNPRKLDSKDDRPVTYWIYKMINKDLWLATIGCISDYYIPEFADDFRKQYPNILPKSTSQGEILFDSEFRKLSKIFVFSLKGKSEDIKKCVKVLTRIENPYEIMNATSAKGKFIAKHIEKQEKNYQKMVDKIMQIKTNDRFLTYTYPSSSDSYTSILSNEITYRNPKKIVTIGRIKGEKIMMSHRAWIVTLPDVIKKSIEGLESATGGGHDHACGSTILVGDFDIFISRFKKLCLEQLNKK